MPEQQRKRTNGAVVLITTCEVCGKMAHNGFGPYWACAKHLTDVSKLWESKGSPQK